MNKPISSPEMLGQLVRETRKALDATRKDLALNSGTGIRFIIDLEKGKPTAQLGKVMVVLQNPGIRMELKAPEPIGQNK